MTIRKIHYIDISKLSRKDAQKLLDEIKRSISSDSSKQIQHTDLIETIATAASFGAFNS